MKEKAIMISLPLETCIRAFVTKEHTDYFMTVFPLPLTYKGWLYIYVLKNVSSVFFDETHSDNKGKVMGKVWVEFEEEGDFYIDERGELFGSNPLLLSDFIRIKPEKCSPIHCHTCKHGDKNNLECLIYKPLKKAPAKKTFWWVDRIKN